MAIEKLWEAQGPAVFTADGTEGGLITVSSVECFKVKQKVKVEAIGEPTLSLQIKRIPTPSTIIVGPYITGTPGSSKDNLKARTDLSDYTVAKSASISAVEQSKVPIPEKDIIQAVYEFEPTVAIRTMSVDKHGDSYEVDNPLPVRLTDGLVNIETVEAHLAVQLSHLDDFPNAGAVADSVRIGDGQYELSINPDGSINVADVNGASALDVRRDQVENITYLGIAAPGSDTADPVWRITRRVEGLENENSSEDEVILVAGSGDFDQVWDDRVSLFPAETPIDFWDRRFERLLPLLANANWFKTGNFDQITPEFTQTAVKLKYFQDSAEIANADVRYVNDLDWSINLTRFINEDDGDMLLDDDDSELNLD